jgi:membrane fusion protein (multidrug efflux system)
MSIQESAKTDESRPASSAGPDHHDAAPHPVVAHASVTPASRGRRGALWLGAILVIAVAGIFGVPWLLKTLSTVSTDDAYVNGHVTFVATRVAGQVARVLVDDNNRVKKGQLLVQLDQEPFQVQVNIAQSAVGAAEAELVVAQSQARGILGQMRSLRFNLEHAIEDVDNQIALLGSRVAAMQSQKATLAKAQSDFDRSKTLVSSNAVSKEEFDQRKEAFMVARAKLEEAQQGVYQVRVALGLPAKSHNGDDLTKVPANLDQTFSTVLQAQASLLQAAAQLGVKDSFKKTPKQMVTDFYKRDPEGDIDRIYENLYREAPIIKQAASKLEQARRNLDQAKLNLRYCDVFAEIDGVITRRNVNPGNNVTVGQSLMAIRSVTDIWIDANFKETQLAGLRIGQPVDIDVDMYGNRQTFKGRITGFTMGTGSTLALLPAENATGNFVKVVQRLPVRIDLIDYDPDQVPLFIGLSVTPYVKFKEAPAGPDAGKILQPYLSTAPSHIGPEPKR